jgi:NAD(P)-dependent dehydrogenase (short-subunit alcohol dehydrogenase family)
LGIADYLVRKGYRLALADRDADAGKEAMDRLGNLRGVHFQAADVSDEGQVRDWVADAMDRFGRMDGLVNNAGISDPDGGPLEALELADWNRVLATNLTGHFLTVKHAAPHLRKARGAVVNIASTRAFQSEADTLAYAASKGGVVALTHAMAVSLGPEIRVNAVSPGWIDVSRWKKGPPPLDETLRPGDHEQHPVGRVGRPEDVAAMTAFLLSEAAGFITGANMTVDGGMTRRMIYLD